MNTFLKFSYQKKNLKSWLHETDIHPTQQKSRNAPQQNSNREVPSTSPLLLTVSVKFCETETAFLCLNLLRELHKTPKTKNALHSG